jgi:Flp pilus assembly protein protease CpaA
MIIDFYIIIALIAVIIGSYTDIKTLEVPDWLNYSLITVGVAANVISAIYYSDFSFIIRCILGLGLSLAIGVSMFYTGQWGGGDSKMLFGLGALLGISYPFRFDFYSMFLLNLLFAGAIYGIIWIIYKSARNWHSIQKKLKIELKKTRKLRMITAVIIIVSLLAVYFVELPGYLKMVLSVLLLIMYSLNYIYVFVRVTEKVSMVRLVGVEKLTEGDWIVDNIVIDGEYISGPKDLGIEKKKIQKLLELKKKGKVDKVKVKYGMPFVPSFLISMIYTIVTNNIILFLIVQ